LPLRPLGVLCFVPLLLPHVVAPRSALTLDVLDVGQGLAVVVRTAQHTLLYDAGPAFEDGFDAGESVVAPFLLELGVHRIDRFVLSHGDLDHRGGVSAVRRLLTIGDEIGTPGHESCRDGQRWSWDGVEFRMLNGPSTGASSNNGGCVLRVAAPDLAVLLPADVEAPTEQRLLREHAELLAADVIVAPHHGSKTSSTAAFVAAVHPRAAIFSAGWRNRFGHPRPEVGARYTAIGSARYVTGTGGEIRVWRDAESGRIEVREYRREAARFWNAEAGP
jgi:competence protein ComEC